MTTSSMSEVIQLRRFLLSPHDFFFGTSGFVKSGSGSSQR
jgi:hypothetical protein